MYSSTINPIFVSIAGIDDVDLSQCLFGMSDIHIELLPSVGARNKVLCGCCRGDSFVISMMKKGLKLLVLICEQMLQLGMLIL